MLLVDNLIQDLDRPDEIESLLVDVVDNMDVPRSSIIGPLFWTAALEFLRDFLTKCSASRIERKLRRAMGRERTEGFVFKRLVARIKEDPRLRPVADEFALSLMGVGAGLGTVGWDALAAYQKQKAA
jgi:hypothetical protein